MEEQVDRLVNKAWDAFQHVPKSRRYLIAVSGIPGSGKTTLAAIVAKRLNELRAKHSPGTANSSQLAAFVPMDGYHLSRKQLDAMPDPQSAHARRGAAFTFDGDSFLLLVKKLREPLLPETSTLYAPSFDHALKDPVADDISIAACVRIVIFEGNYLSLSKSPWKDAAELMDQLWFVDVDFNEARKRLVYRHIKAGLAKDEEEAGKRADENDLVNGKEIVDGRLEVHEVVRSEQDSSWAPEMQGVGNETDKEHWKQMLS
ncbi:P-loop containing nucleoside triphosphate hydrolase protein [Amniculicola lignicola CBS 123094]|uniref:P-loop containing nucleoside triphosphate hydrolase protein n=1 Tax=Amniculicola lignicola CBS 123094 TaxID=1392246 RepID=A0A6A5WP07_9PLEO|nr:P-loop containing nucleoside triphosphate hydrolase protein [Amniculicola lignicola CBS 123094]